MDKNFRIEVKNFGAVKDGNFDIKPLTIFIGDNDSGKSYISKFIYIVVKYLNNYSVNTMKDMSKEKYKDTELLKTLEIYIKSLNTKENTNIQSQITIDLDDKFMDYFINDIKTNYEQILKKSLEIYFSTNLGELVNIHKEEASIIIYTKYTTIKLIVKKDGTINLSLEDVKILNIKLNLYTLVNEINDSFSMSYDVKDNNIEMDISLRGNSITDITYLFDRTIDMIFYTQNSFTNLPHTVDYFPANKSGILSNYNTHFQNLDKSSAIEYIYNDKNINQDNYIVNDFIKIIQRYSIKSIKVNDNLCKSYKYILDNIDGKIYFNDSKMLQYNIGNSENNLDIPIENISTKVTELTPILLYLKEQDNQYLELQNPFLIIEEPESHLNPKMQRIMARLLVMMMNEGIQILITTHSDYILNEMDILLKLNHIKEKDTNRFDGFIEEDKEYDSLMALDKNDISVYRFKKVGLDTDIENIKITKNKVIEKEFEETSENLYLENSKVIEILKSL